MRHTMDTPLPLGPPAGDPNGPTSPRHVHPQQKARATSAGEAVRKIKPPGEPAVHVHPSQNVTPMDIEAGVDIKPIPRVAVIARGDADVRVMDQRKSLPTGEAVPSSSTAAQLGIAKVVRGTSSDKASLREAGQDRQARRRALEEDPTAVLQPAAADLGVDVEDDGDSEIMQPPPELSDPLQPTTGGTPRPTTVEGVAATPAVQARRKRIAVDIELPGVGDFRVELLDIATSEHGVVLMYDRDAPSRIVPQPGVNVRVSLADPADIPDIADGQYQGVSLGASFVSVGFGVILVPLITHQAS